MSDGLGGDGSSQKLFPRNTTARAARVVRGNPVVSRPEDGVENCFPGLEFDQRNLDKVFFPGLVFEFHHGLGAFVRAVEPDLLPAALRPLAPSAADIEAGLFLFWLGGVREGDSPDLAGRGLAALSDLRRLGDLDVWRVVRDLEPGPVQLVLAPASRFGAGGAFEQTADRMVRAGQDRVLRDPAGAWQLGLLTGSRARFLTEDGVLDPALLAAGDLTRSLCAPWQYDFADCGCFYWAANKPDMAASPSQPRRILAFQRLDRSRDAERRPIGDIGRWEQIRGGTDPNATMDHADVIRQWEDLPFVVAETETDRFAPRPAPSSPELLNRAEVVRRLRYLAGVEHALSVEYLYAFYSLAAPRQRPVAADDPVGRVFTAAEEVFRVAVDEMRHLRWVNEMLGLLGEPHELGRAGIIGEDLDGDGRAFERPFELLPLTPAQLQWFVDVEDRSNDFDPGGNDDSVDGMYTRILLSIQQLPDFADDERERLAHLVKLIIDEGIDHFQRFRRAQEALAGLDPGTYLRLDGPPGGARGRTPRRRPAAARGRELRGRARYARLGAPAGRRPPRPAPRGGAARDVQPGRRLSPAREPRARFSVYPALCR